LNTKEPILAISLGDTDGVGPEIIEKSLRNINLDYSVVIIGDKDKLSLPNMKIIKDISYINAKGIYFIDIVSKSKYHNSFKFVQAGVKLALKKDIDALVTAPISKEKWKETNIKYKGHTGYLADSAGVNNYAMTFWSDSMRVVLYTTHIPLNQVSQLIEKNKIVNFIRFINKELSSKFNKQFKILIPGFNPHAGENGLIGDEEKNEIIPAISILEKEMNITGPFPPDTIYMKAMTTEDTVVIAWYHDQGLIPFKLLNIHSGVNLTLGLPYIRTSPDHGTAFDIAGKNIANPSSMTKAILLAQKLMK